MKNQINNPQPLNINLPSHFSDKEEKKEMEELGKASEKSSNNHVIWDCGSSLYDSFERNEFHKQLNSALAARTLSMPHLSHRRPPPPPPNKKQASSKISRSFQKLIRAVFKPKTNKHSVYEGSKQGFCDTIPEVPEFDQLRRAASARFTSSASLGITCS